jgi:hypothetical protein
VTVSELLNRRSGGIGDIGTILIILVVLLLLGRI